MDVVTNPTLDRLLKRMCPEFLSILSEQHALSFYEFRVEGAEGFAGLYLKSPYGVWADHPKASEISAACTERGVEWFAGVSTARSTIVSNRSGSVVLAGGGTFQSLAMNKYAPTVSAAFVLSCMSTVGWVHSVVRTRIVAAMVEVTQTPGTDCVNYSHADWQWIDTTSRELAKRLGFKPLSDVKVRCVSHQTPASISGNPAVYNYPTRRVDSISRMGIKYLIIPVSVSANTTDMREVLVPVVDDGTSLVHAVYYSNVMTGELQGITTFAMPGRYVHNSDHNGWYPADFLDVPEHYKTDFLGRVSVVADFAGQAYAPNVPIAPSLRDKMNVSNGLKLLPLLCPPGEATYYVRGLSSEMSVDEVVYEVQILNPTTGVPAPRNVSVTRVSFPARDILSAVPQAWYAPYLASGYGFYKGKGTAEAEKAAVAMKSLNSYVHTAVFQAAPVTVPQDIVTRLDIYRDYKKAKEKACLRNDFMEQKFNEQYTWGQVNDMCNKAGSLSVLYGFGSSVPSLQAAVKYPTVTGIIYSVDKTQPVWTVTLSRDGVAQGTVSPTSYAQMWEDIALGASLSNAGVADLAANWGFDAAVMQAERGDSQTVGNRMASATVVGTRGRGGAASDFAWENMGVSGFPLVRELSVNDGFKAIINSVVVVGMKTAPLHAAYLGFARLATNSMLRK